jgi:hypothetical protein
MLSRFRRHFRQQLVGYLALFVALGGTAFAAVTVTGASVENGSLTGTDVKNNSLHGRDIQGIHGQDIAADAVNSDEIEDHSIRAFDLAADALAGIKGDKGETGPAGPAGANGKDGAKGDTGPPGPPGTDATGGSGGSSSVVNRSRSSGPVTPTAHGTQELVPLTGNTWTQAADELDQFFGTANITVPANCRTPPDPGGNDRPGSATVQILLSRNGGTPTVVGQANSGISNVPVVFSLAHLFEPGSDETHTFTARFSDACATGDHATLNSLKLDVIGTR